MIYMQIIVGLLVFSGCQLLPSNQEVRNIRQVQLEILGAKGKALLNKNIIIDDSSKLIPVTMKALDESKVPFKTEVLCGETGLVEVEDLKTQEVKTGKNNLKSYGWCYFIDDQLFEIAPGKFDMKNVKNKITWAYSYSEKRNNDWVSQCIKDQ